MGLLQPETTHACTIARFCGGGGGGKKEGGRRKEGRRKKVRGRIALFIPSVEVEPASWVDETGLNQCSAPLPNLPLRPPALNTFV